MSVTPQPQIPAADEPFLEDCTVTAVAPLRIRRDADESELPFTPRTLVSPSALTIGDRVSVYVDGMLVIGKADGTAIAAAATANTLPLRDALARMKAAAGAAADDVAVVGQLNGANLAINGTFRTNQMGYVSATDVASGVYAFDGWKATTANSRLTFTANVFQGQTVTIASGDSWCQDVERTKIRPGYHVLSWPGTAQARVYNVGGSAPAYAASPIVVNIDGAAHVRLEFGPGTVSVGDEGVKFERGTIPTPFVLDPLDVELEKCFWLYRRIPGNAANDWLSPVGFQFSTTTARIPFPWAMRAIPTFTYSDVYWSDDVNFETALSTLVASARDGGGGQLILADATFAASGAALRPGVLRAHSSSSYIALDARL